LEDIKAIIDGESQTDGTFRTTKLYTRMSAEEVRKQLIEQKGYVDKALPIAKTIGVKMNEMGYQLRPVAKSKPQKK
jgi:Rhodopirellula transposase DDE domain